MIIKHLLVFSKITSSRESLNDDQKSPDSFVSSTSDHVNRIHHNLSRIRIKNETKIFTIHHSPFSTLFESASTIQSTNDTKQIVQNSSKLQAHCPFSNCTCLSLEIYNRKHNDSELNLINHCLYLNLTTIENRNKFILYEQFHPFQLHQIRELNLNYNNLTSLSENLVLNTGHNQTIEILNLSHNQLDKFPRLKDLNHSLKRINLDHNLIIHLSINRTRQLSTFGSLIELNLSQNRIRLIKRSFLNLFCNQLKYIDLSSNRLRKLDSKLFVDCKQLEILKLNRNKLNRIAFDSFDNLTNLIQLDFSRNNLTNLKINFESLTNLKILNLSKNQLKTIDSTFEHLVSLQTLNLNENNLVNLRESLVKGLKSLKLLQLPNNQIKQVDANWFDCRNLVNLYLEHNQIDHIGEKTFKGLINLEKLYLDYNRITSIDLHAFQTNPNLIWLFMNDNDLNRFVEKNRTLFVHNKLQYLALENNHLTYIPNQLFLNLTSLITIDLSLNQLKFIEHNALEPLIKLDELNFDSTNLECDCKLKWFVNYYQEKSIENIYLEQLECKTPQNLANKSFIDVDVNFFLCEDDLKPYFLKEPKKQTLAVGQQFELKCKVAINSFINEDIIFEWRKNNRTLALNNEINIVEIMKLNKDINQSNKLIYSSHLKFLNASINDQGDYRCIAYMKYYGSIESRIARIICSEPPLPPILYVDTVRKNSTIIKWIQNGNKNELTHYVLYYRHDKTVWLWVTFAAKEKNYTLTGLNKSTLYEIYMKAISHYGLSEPSKIVRQITQSSIKDSASRHLHRQYPIISSYLRSYIVIPVLIAFILIVLICSVAVGYMKYGEKKAALIQVSSDKADRDIHYDRSSSKEDDGTSIENFVEKVVFNLHQSFTKPKRVLKEQPFEVSEQGYASFMLPIDIHFKNKGEPKKVTYDYDMYLRVGDSVNTRRKEKLIFHNPAEEFKKRLIKAGGVVHNETASKNRLNNLAIPNNPNSTNISNSGTTTTTSIRSKNFIPSKDKSQQQHSSAASSNNSPSNFNQSNKKDESSKSTKDKQHQTKQNSESFTELFGTPIKTSSKDKNLKEKIKKSKSSSEKSSNSSTPTSINNQLAKDYSDSENKSKDKESYSINNSKLNKSSSSNSSSNSHSRSLLQKDDKLNRIKKEIDSSFDTLSPLSKSLKSEKSPSSFSTKYQELDKNNNNKYSKNQIKSNLSSSSSSLNSDDDNHQNNRNNLKQSTKKRKKRSDSVSSNDSNRSRLLSAASLNSVKSSLSHHSSSSNLSSVDLYEHKKRNHKINDELRSPVKKKKKRDQSNNSEKEIPNIAASRTLSSSLSSVNSEYKSKNDLKKKIKEQKFKDEPKDNYYSSKSKDCQDQSSERKFKTKTSKVPSSPLIDEDVEIKKERKEKKRSKDESSKKSIKKNKSKESKESKTEKKKHKSSKPDQTPENIVKEKNKDSMSKQASHKENNLKKEATTSTKISFSNDNSTGVKFEYTFVKNVKMHQSESKKSKQYQDQSINQSDKRSFKNVSSEKSNTNNGSSHPYSSPLINTNNKKNYENENSPSCSPCSTSDKLLLNSSSNHNNVKQEAFTTKNDYHTKRNQKLNNSYEKIMSDMRKDREISPLSSDLNSEMDDFNMENDYGSNDESALKINNYNEKSIESDNDDKKRKDTNVSSYLDDESEESDDELNVHVDYINELIDLQKQINELKDKELLTEIVDIVEKSGKFEMNGTLFDFDLMKLDKTTIQKVKLCFI